LGVVEVSQQSAEVLPILDRGFDLSRKGRPYGALATGAVFDFGPMLGAFQREGGQIIDLASFEIQDRLVVQILAALTMFQAVNLNVIGLRVEGEGATGMVGLAAGFAPRFASQALGFGPLAPVGGRRTRTIAAILGSGVLQPSHFSLELEGVIHQPIQVSFAPML
jgi:hypothetical protein